MGAGGIGGGRRRSRAFIVGSVSVVLLVGLTVFLFLYPVPTTATDRASFAIPLPYVTSDVECHTLTLSHGGSLSFVVTFSNGDVTILMVRGPANVTEFRESSNTSVAGTVNGVTLGSYGFCLSVPQNYTYEGGLAFVNATLSYPTAAPIL